MKNLTGLQANQQIIEELQEAGIDIVLHERRLYTEPITNITGEYGGIKFERAWRYWVVTGDIYLDDAEKMYATEIGKTDIRAGGSCTCPPPLEYAEPSGKRFEILVQELTESGHINEEKARDIVLQSRKVNLFHIDSQKGLNLFVNTLINSKKNYGPDNRVNKIATILSNATETMVHTQVPSGQQLRDEEEIRYKKFCEEQDEKEVWGSRVLV